MWLLLLRRQPKLVFEIVERLFAPDFSLIEIGGQDVLVCIDRIIPDEQGDGEQHRSVQIFPVGGRPPQSGEQGEVALLELLASTYVWYTTNQAALV